MNCEEFREVRGGTTARTDEEAEAAWSHMDDCPCCMSWFDAELQHHTERFQSFLKDNPEEALGFYMGLAAHEFPQAQLVRGADKIGRS